MVVASGFEPPTSWSRIRFALLKFRGLAGLREDTGRLCGTPALGKPCCRGRLNWRLILKELVKLIAKNNYKLAATPGFEAAFPDSLTDEPSTDACVSCGLRDA